MNSKRPPRSREEKAQRIMNIYNAFRLTLVLLFIAVSIYLMNK